MHSCNTGASNNRNNPYIYIDNNIILTDRNVKNWTWLLIIFYDLGKIKIPWLENIYPSIWNTIFSRCSLSRIQLWMQKLVTIQEF
jgi:hypothetical protein